MSKATSTTKKADDSMYDMEDLPSTINNSPARIEKPGITHNLSVKFALVDGDYKDAEAKAASPDGKWHGFEVTVTDESGLELSEVYFMPPQKVEDVKFLQKDFQLTDGKLVEAGDASPIKSLKIVNNEFMAYLIDLGEAMGYNNNDIKEKLRKHATGFINLAKGFIDNFKPAENTRISAKILYNNNTKKETSFLKLHGPYTVYYPFGNDIFDVYAEGRPTLLKLSKWEAAQGMTKKFTNETDAPKTGATTSGESWKAAVEGDDPF